MLAAMTSLALLAHTAHTAAPGFNTAFYATTATVIPVLFLAIAVQGRTYEDLLKAAGDTYERGLRRQHLRQPHRASARPPVPLLATWALLSTALIIMCFAVLAEITALICLYQQSPTADPGTVITAAILLTIALSLRWRDVDFERATVAVRRSAGMVREFGEGAEMVEDDTKSSKPRVVDLDSDTVTAGKAWKRQRGEMHLSLARPDSLVYGTVEGEHRNGEHVWRQFTRDLARCRKALGADAVPVIRVHDLRHTHATLLQMSRVASDASFRRIREPVWPAVLFTAGQAAAGRAMW